MLFGNINIGARERSKSFFSSYFQVERTASALTVAARDHLHEFEKRRLCPGNGAWTTAQAFRHNSRG